MPDLGRFISVDPLAEKFNNQSPYLYAYNNPVRFTDYMGMGGEDEVKKEDLQKALDEGNNVQERVENIDNELEEGQYVTGETVQELAGITPEAQEGELPGTEEQRELIGSIDKIEKTEGGYEVKLKDNQESVDKEIVLPKYNEETGQYEKGMSFDVKIKNNASVTMTKNEDGSVKIDFKGITVGKGFLKVGIPSLTVTGNSGSIMGFSFPFEQ